MGVMKTQTQTMTDIYNAIHSDICDKLDYKVGLDNEASDLHHYLCNEDYFIIGTFKARGFLGTHAFECINKIKEYEQDNFGECNTDLSEPEKVVNMLAYIVGEEILSESDALRDAWDSCLDDDTYEEVKQDIASLNINKVYYSHN